MQHRQGLKILARAGYAARGVVYLIIGYFALVAAFGRGETEDSEGAIETLLGQPFGTVLVGLMVVGLLGYCMWRLIQAVRDVDDHGTGAKGLAVRAGLSASALTHLGLALFAFSLLAGWGGDSGGGGGDPTGGWIAAVLEQGWGRVAAWGAAILMAIVGIAHIVKAWRAGFEKYIDADPRLMDHLRPICRIGLVARGAVFMVFAIMLFYANAIYDVEDAPGLKDALDFIQELAFGSVLLGLMGLGLLSFAVYSFIQAAYRRVEFR